MSRLREQMLANLQLKGLSPKTQKKLSEGSKQLCQILQQVAGTVWREGTPMRYAGLRTLAGIGISIAVAMWTSPTTPAGTGTAI